MISLEMINDSDGDTKYRTKKQYHHKESMIESSAWYFKSNAFIIIIYRFDIIFNYINHLYSLLVHFGDNQQIQYLIYYMHLSHILTNLEHF